MNLAEKLLRPLHFRRIGFFCKHTQIKQPIGIAFISVLDRDYVYVAEGQSLK